MGDDKFDRTPVREQPYFASDKEQVEIEAKITLTRKLDILALAWPSNFRVEVTTKERVSQHVFFYDEADNYLYSVTDGSHFKMKTEPQIEVVDGVPVLIRWEVIKPYQCMEPLKYHRSRRLMRERTNLWLVDVLGSSRFFVCYDKCTSQSGEVLHQLEIEFACPTSNERVIEPALKDIVKLVKHAKLWSPHDFDITTDPLTKYDWLKQTKEVSGWRRFFSRG